MSNGIKIDNVIKLFDTTSSNKIMWRAIKSLKVTKDNVIRYIILMLICVFPTVIISKGINTKDLFVDAIDCILAVALGLFGIVFTGYAFFQALINKELLKQLLNNTTQKEEGEELSKLQETNNNFVDLMMLMLLVALSAIFLRITCSGLDNSFCLFEKRATNNWVAGSLILVYFSFVTLVFWEVKSFIFNVFQLFNAHAGARAMEIVKEEENS